jgi:hypothetical protein
MGLPEKVRPMLGQLVALLVIVDGLPGSSAEFPPDEQVVALREAYAGLALLRGLADAWGQAQPVPVRNVLRFTVVQQTVRLPLDPTLMEAPSAATAARRDVPWLHAALSLLGVDDDALVNRIDALRRSLSTAVFFGLGAADAFPVFITKYPSFHQSHAEFRSVVVSRSPITPSVVNDPFLARNVDGVIAHEIGHVFGAPDEYGLDQNLQPHCRIADTAGFFDTINANCAILPTGADNPAHVDCLMTLNTHNLCAATPVHWGWVDRDGDGVADPAAQAIVAMRERVATRGQPLRIDGRNVYDTRLVSFGGVLAAPTLPPAQPDTIDVVVPPTVPDGITTVSVVTRAGPSSGSFDDSWVVVSAATPPSPGNGPAIFGVVPSSGPPGSVVRLLGTRLVPVTNITFGGVGVNMAQVDPLGTDPDGEFFDVEVPAGPSGTVPVVLTTAQGSSPPFAGFAQFTYT